MKTQQSANIFLTIQQAAPSVESRPVLRNSLVQIYHSSCEHAYNHSDLPKPPLSGQMLTLLCVGVDVRVATTSWRENLATRYSNFTQPNLAVESEICAQ
jgi:hypothetical protein